MADEPKPPLAYQIGSSPVTRGQFRLLLLLMLIQVVITAQSAYAPGFIAWVKGLWAGHQQVVAHRAQVQKNLATMQRCMSFAQPATTVVWDEDPDRAATLLAAGGYVRIRLSGTPDFVSNALPPGEMADISSFALGMAAGILQRSPNSTLVFLHGRRAATGPERLVAVTVGATVEVANQGSHSVDDKFDFSVFKIQSFAAQSFLPSAEGEADSDVRGWCELALEDEQSGVEMRGHWSPPAARGEPGGTRIPYADQLRVFAGQPDPADSSHFTIPYEL
ncbi:MAG TPA: hypothetical protein VGI81_18750, partial [Tepidisphaeraceae bacterium]